MDSVTFKIDDLGCAECVAGVQMVTEGLDGVLSTELNLQGKCGTWEVDLSKISAIDIQEEIEKLGYTVTQIIS